VFKVWNFIDAGLHARSTGHHYWETKALADELLTRGAEVRVFSCRDAPVAGFPGARVHPTFTLNYYASVSNDPCWGLTENFVAHNLSFQGDLFRTDPSLFHGALTVFPTLCERQLLATIRWLTHFKDDARPKAVATLQPLGNWSDDNPSAGIYRRLWADCPAAVKKDMALTTRGSETAAEFHRLLGVRPHVLPSPVGNPGRRARIGANATSLHGGPMVVSFVAGARRERGALHIPDVVKSCADTRFFIQAKDEGDVEVDVGLLTALGGLPNVELHQGLLAPDAYYDAIARSVVLYPLSSRQLPMAIIRRLCRCEIPRRPGHRVGEVVDGRGGEIARQRAGVRGLQPRGDRRRDRRGAARD
jgi:hypothetical protein